MWGKNRRKTCTGYNGLFRFRKFQWVVSGFFSISYSGSNKSLFASDCANLVNYRKTHTKHWSTGDLQRYKLFFGIFGFLLSLKLLWDYETADNFLFLRVSFKRSYERKEILSNDNYTLNYKKGTTKSTKVWRKEIKLNKHT